MGLCVLARLSGEAINAAMTASGSNLQELLGLLRREAGRFVFSLIRWYRNLIAELCQNQVNKTTDDATGIRSSKTS